MSKNTLVTIPLYELERIIKRGERYKLLAKKAEAERKEAIKTLATYFEGISNE